VVVCIGRALCSIEMEVDCADNPGRYCHFAEVQHIGGIAESAAVTLPRSLNR
jgi:hypothetical protein